MFQKENDEEIAKKEKEKQTNSEMNIANEVTLEERMNANDREAPPTTVHEIEGIRMIEQTKATEILKNKIVHTIEKAVTAGKDPTQAMKRTAENNP